MRDKKMGNFLYNLRTEMSVTQNSLCEGLCVKQHLCKIEGSEVDADQLLYETLLQRLGKSGNFFEHYLSQEEYHRQLVRMHIAKYLKNGDLENARNCIEEYRLLSNKEKGIASKLHEQYSLYMEAEILKVHLLKEKRLNKDLFNMDLFNMESKETTSLGKVSSNEFLKSHYIAVIQMTVPRFQQVPLDKLFLSSIELCAILEYSVLCGEKALALFLELLNYIHSKNIEKEANAILYPKLVYIIAEKWLQQENYLAIIDLCSKAIEYLRTEHSSYYMVELLEMKMICLKKLNLHIDSKEYETLARWKDCLVSLYEEYDINYQASYPMFPKSFIIMESYVLGDAIRNRRNMLEITQDELMDGICSHTTISRIESLAITPRPNTAYLLLEKLNLNPELFSNNIITSDYAVHELNHDLTDDIAFYRLEQAKEKLRILTERLDLNEKINHQYIRYYDITLQNLEGNLTHEKTLQHLIETLAITLPLKSIFNRGKKHFSKKEILLINTIANQIDILNEIDELQLWTGVLEDYFVNDDFNYLHFNFYIFTCLNLQSIYGNSDDFGKSFSLIEKMVTQSLGERTLHRLDHLVCDIGWNYKAQIEKISCRILNEKENKKYRLFLNTACTLSEINKSEHLELFIKSKLEKTIL